MGRGREPHPDAGRPRIRAAGDPARLPSARPLQPVRRPDRARGLGPLLRPHGNAVPGRCLPAGRPEPAAVRQVRPGPAAVPHAVRPGRAVRGGDRRRCRRHAARCRGRVLPARGRGATAHPVRPGLLPAPDGRRERRAARHDRHRGPGRRADAGTRPRADGRGDHLPRGPDAGLDGRRGARADAGRLRQHPARRQALVRMRRAPDPLHDDVLAIGAGAPVRAGRRGLGAADLSRGELPGRPRPHRGRDQPAGRQRSEP